MSQKETANKRKEGSAMVENNKEKNQRTSMDNPEQYSTSKESLHDKFESELTVDPIPLEDLRLEMKEEKDGHHTKDSSSSEKKFQADYKQD
jgi:hypothetical protein